MRNNSKRVIAILAACLLLAGATVSCRRDAEGDGNDKNDTVIISGEVGKFEVPEGVAKDKTFSMYLAMSSVKSSYIAEEQTGSTVNDMVFERNQLVEEHTGVKLNFVSSTRATTGNDQDLENNLIRTLIQSGDTTYDAFLHAQRTAMFTLVEEGMFTDWNLIPYINLENPWWYANVIRDVNYGDKIFCMTGDYNLNTFSETECLLFNKTMCDELGLDYPYQMVFDGTWTHDKFIEYIKAATKDLNGDGKMSIENDRYGFGGWKYEQIPALYLGYGGLNVTKDENGLPKLNIDNETTYTIVDSMIEVFKCEGAFLEGATYGVDDRMFNEGRLMFNDSFLTSVVGARSLEEIDVGFVPYPKLDEDQPEYYSRTANISGLTFIPITNTDLEKTGAVLESLAYYSTKTIMPAYFDELLMIKSTRDVESEEMIPIIRNSSRFMDSVIGFTGTSMVESKTNTLSSYIAANKDSWDLKIEKLKELYIND